jgi:DNA repair protein RadA
MLALEIDRLNEIDDSIKDQLKQAGFNSIKDIVIRGPVQVAKSAEIEIDEASSICNKASLLLEQLGAIPNSISSNNSCTFNKEYIKTGSAELDSLFGGKGIETWSSHRILRPIWKWKNANLSYFMCHNTAAAPR